MGETPKSSDKRACALVRAGGSGLVYVATYTKLGRPEGRPTRRRASSPAAFPLSLAGVLGGTWCVLGSLEGLSFQRVAVVCVPKSTGPVVGASSLPSTGGKEGGRVKRTGRVKGEGLC